VKCAKKVYEYTHFPASELSQREVRSVGKIADVEVRGCCLFNYVVSNADIPYHAFAGCRQILNE
jgi:hypothetical protein